ncbi:hypothetical protein GLOIN_2v1735248 [Rhizophagus clarus]|uniref:Uncharacterized protein n=1 Tax=Rhizophagus clarus TaxID=94130 RepID=A0A8H3LNC4_9GLOM|nr:hypothetical protein GLOIN_2v1735248 [Rhizophagus clarus]
MATKRGEKQNIDDNKRISRRNTEKSSEAEKQIRLSDDNVEVQQHRSIRGTFTSRVKGVMYSVFEATGHKLPFINTQVSLSKIQEWKTADDRAGAADDGATNDGRPNNGVANDSAANNGATNDSIADDDILSSDSYNTKEEGQYVNSLLENYGLHRK